MPPLVTVLIGPAGGGKTDRLLERYRAALSVARPQSTLWLAPTSRAAVEVRSRLLGGKLDGCLAPGVNTFAGFALAVLQHSPQPVRPLSSLLKRQLVGDLVDEAGRDGRLTHFGPIASTSGLLDLLCDFIRQMKRLEIWPEQFAEACQQRGVTEKDRELLAIYGAYQQRLLDHNLYDAEGCFWSARDLLRRRPIAYQFIVADGFSDFTQTEHDILQELAAHAEELWISLPMEGVGRVVSSAATTHQEIPALTPCPSPEYGRGENIALTPCPSPRAPCTHGRGRGEREREDRSKNRRHPSTLILHPSSFILPPLSARTFSRNRRRRWRNCAADTRTFAWKRIARPEKPTWPAMAHVERTVFSNPRTMTDAPDTAGLEILAGGRQIGEIELIGRRIKRLLMEGDLRTHHAPRDGFHHAERDEYIRPGQIAVVFRHPQALADLVSEVFQRLGDPLSSWKAVDRWAAVRPS